jgi:MFS family permease
MNLRKNKKQNNVFWFGVISFFTDFSSEMLMPILPVFYESLGINKAFIGIIEGVAESFSSFLKVVSGYLSDKLKKRKIFIVLGYGLPAFLKPFYIFATGWVYILIVRILERTGKGFRDPPRDALLYASATENHIGLAFGWQRTMDTLGAVSGVLTLTVILYFIPDTLKPLFLIAFIPGIISFLISVFKVKEDKYLAEETKKIKVKEIVRLPKIYKFFLIPTFIFGIGNMSYAFFILRASDLGLPLALIPIVYLVYTITYAAFALYAGNLSDKIGKIPTLIIGNLFFFAAVLLFTFKVPIVFIWVAFIMYGLFFAFNVGSAKAFITESVPKSYSATAVGIHNFILGICALPASIIVGFLWEMFNPQIAFTYSAVLTAISTILYLAIMLKFRNPAH